MKFSGPQVSKHYCCFIIINIDFLNKWKHLDLGSIFFRHNSNQLLPALVECMENFQYCLEVSVSCFVWVSGVKARQIPFLIAGTGRGIPKAQLGFYSGLCVFFSSSFFFRTGNPLCFFKVLVLQDMECRKLEKSLSPFGRLWHCTAFLKTFESFLQRKNILALRIGISKSLTLRLK